MDKPITISSLDLGLTLCGAEFFNANTNKKTRILESILNYFAPKRETYRVS